MIRQAYHYDIPEMVEMSRKFYATTEYINTYPFNEDFVALRHKELIEDGIMLVADNVEIRQLMGMIGCMIAPFYFNPDFGEAIEVVWYVEPSYEALGIGKSLLESAERLAKAEGCTAMKMATLASSPPHAKAWLEKQGYVYGESYYTKVL